MTVLNHEDGPRPGGMGKVLAIGAGVVALFVGGYLAVTMLTPAPKPKDEPPPVRTEAPKVEPKQAAPQPEPETPKPTRPKPKKEKPVESAPPAPPPPAGPVLVVDSDVPGASVFIDRKYVGTTPLRTTEVTPGAHQLNASATGEEGIARGIEIGETGETGISLRFREVRLNAAVAVVHKHAMGLCEGRLVATVAGLAYETSNTKDAFTIGFGALESFEIDYLKKELKVKQRGGKTWNFTDRSDNADKLFVFHRDVTKAREKLGTHAR